MNVYPPSNFFEEPETDEPRYEIPIIERKYKMHLTIHDKIETYQRKNKIKTRGEALERMLAS